MGEKVKTVGGVKATKPLSDFCLQNVGLGKVFYADYTNGDNGRNGRSPETAVKTLTYALSLTTANKGDVIYLMPGHAETLATAGAIAVSKAGVTIIGMGSGALRPTFTFSAVDATMTITAANVTMTNFIVKPSIDSVVSPLVVSASGVILEYESQDASSTVEFVNTLLTTAAADNLTVKMKHLGFIAGDAGVNGIRLVGCNNANIEVDYYGKASTAIVEFHTTACSNIFVKGTTYNESAATTKNVVDTQGASTWACEIYDAKAGAKLSGGSAGAIAADDVGAVAAAIAVIDEFHDVPAANNTLNAQINEVIGNKSDTAASGAVTTTDTLVAYVKQLVTEGITRDALLGSLASSAATGAVTETDTIMAYVKQLVTEGIARDLVLSVLGAIDTAAATGAVTDTDLAMAYIKQLVTELQVIDEFHDVPAANNTENAQINEVIGNKTDTAAAGAVTETDTIVAYLKQLVTAEVSREAAFGTILASATVVSSGIPNNTQVGGTIFTATGTVLVEDITFNTDSTGLATPTNIEISTNNVSGLTGAAAPVFVEVIASFGANLTVSKKDATSHAFPFLLESGKAIFIHGDDAAGTGAGVATVTLIGKAISAGATIAASNIAGI